MRVFIGLVVLAIIISVALVGAQKFDKAATAIEVPAAAIPTAPAAEQDEKWLRQVAALRRLRQSMKNPAAFRLEQAIEMTGGTLCVTYWATNSFNAVVPGHAVIEGGRTAISDAQAGFQAAWDRRCNARRGTDVTHIRQAL